MPDGHQFVVDLRTDAFGTNGTVDGKGEIKGSGTDGQHLDISLWREDVYLFRQEGGLEIMQKID
jgi:hypothetical protein